MVCCTSVGAQVALPGATCVSSPRPTRPAPAGPGPRLRFPSLETTSFTLVPTGSFLPAPGLLEITLPLGTFRECFLVTVPTLQPAFVIFCSAFAFVKPATCGTTHPFRSGLRVVLRDAFIVGVRSSRSLTPSWSSARSSR